MENLLKHNKELHESFGKSVGKIISYFDNPERDAMLNRLRDQVVKSCSMEEKLKAEARISKDISSSYDPEAATDNDHLENYKIQIAEIIPNLSENDNMKEFDRIVRELCEAEENDNETDDKNADDAELQLTRDTMNLIDPVTKKRMTDPVRNTICSHIYDRESVVALLKMNPLSRCPVPGCKYRQALSMNDMKTDIVTKSYLEKHPA